jgi:hypothetical protein
MIMGIPRKQTVKGGWCPPSPERKIEPKKIDEELLRHLEIACFSIGFGTGVMAAVNTVVGGRGRRAITDEEFYALSYDPDNEIIKELRERFIESLGGVKKK